MSELALNGMYTVSLFVMPFLNLHWCQKELVKLQTSIGRPQKRRWTLFQEVEDQTQKGMTRECNSCKHKTKKYRGEAELHTTD